MSTADLVSNFAHRRPSLRRRNERGAVAVVLSLFIVVVMIPMSALVVDLSRVYLEAHRAQAAADAAATAGVTYMPDDFDKAKARALEIAEDNGYKPGPAIQVNVEAGEKPTQLKVSVTSTIDNSFGEIFGVDTATVTRSAVADFNGPAPMGSPCNTYANEPDGTDERGPKGSQLQVPSPAECSRKPMFWASAAGPNVVKTQGDQFGTRFCAGGESGCAGGAGSANKDYDANGYFYLVRIGPNAAGHRFKLQIFDPAYVPTASRCDSVTSVPNNNNWSPYAKTDAMTRYAASPTQFCTGDNPNSLPAQIKGVTTHVPTVTSFGLRGVVDTLQPMQAPQIAGCAKQYPGYGSTGTTTTYPNRDTYKGASATAGSPYDDKLARVFHHWVTMCEFTAQLGDQYLQVRTNVPLNTSSYDGDGGYNNSNIYAAGEQGANGTGTNRFGLRLVPVTGGITSSKDVSIAAYERMPIFANNDGASTTFNLVRVPPAAVNKTLVFSFFDVGEGANGGTMTVLQPVELTGWTPNNCKGTGKVTGDLPGCSITGISSAAGWDGQYQEIRVPIPSTYTCEWTSPGGCWFRVKVAFPGGSVTDATTWTARIEGEPIRLLE